MNPVVLSGSRKTMCDVNRDSVIDVCYGPAGCPECGAKLVKVGDRDRCSRCPCFWPWWKP